MKISARTLFYALPPAWRFAARRLCYLPLDTWETLNSKRGELHPPKGMIYTGGGDFLKTGEMLLGYFRELGGLQAHHHLLDVGSGIGRIAIPLTRFLNEKGGYEGFDVVRQGVDWCGKHISRRYPNFQFQYISLDNDLYRSGGGDASVFRFPYPEGRFDFAVVNSVFTHMLPEEVDNYFGEIFRTLRPGGVCYATFFLFDPAKPEPLPKDFEFAFDYGHYRLMDDAVKSANVAFREDFFRKNLLEKHGFTLRHLCYGSWRGLPPGTCKEFQDIAVFSKPG